MPIRFVILFIFISGLLLAQNFEQSKFYGSQYFKHDMPVKGITLSPDGKYILTGDGKNIMLWDRKTGAFLRTIGKVEHGITDLQYLGDGSIFALEDSC